MVGCRVPCDLCPARCVSASAEGLLVCCEMPFLEEDAQSKCKRKHDSEQRNSEVDS